MYPVLIKTLAAYLRKRETSETKRNGRRLGAIEKQRTSLKSSLENFLKASRKAIFRNSCCVGLTSSWISFKIQKNQEKLAECVANILTI